MKLLVFEMWLQCFYFVFPEIIILERQSRSIVATFQTPEVSLEFIVSDKE